MEYPTRDEQVTERKNAFRNEISNFVTVSCPSLYQTTKRVSFKNLFFRSQNLFPDVGVIFCFMKGFGPKMVENTDRACIFQNCLGVCNAQEGPFKSMRCIRTDKTRIEIKD